MDQTVNRGYSYPQCEPPLIKDEANAPLQTRILAEEMAADFTTVQTTINNQYQLPSAIITMAGPTALASGDSIPFDTTEYDAEAWADPPGITVDSTGLYLMTLSVQESTGTTSGLMVQFMRDGAGFALQGTSPAAVGFGRMAANVIDVLSSGQTLTARLTYIGAASSFVNARLTATRMVAF